MLSLLVVSCGYPRPDHLSSGDGASFEGSPGVDAQRDAGVDPDGVDHHEGGSPGDTASEAPPLLNDGEPCTSASSCASGACTTYYRDDDADSLGGVAVDLCGTTATAGYVTTGGDCCDLDARVPLQGSDYFSAPDTCGSYDYNCDGQATTDAQDSGQTIVYPTQWTCSDGGGTVCRASFATFQGFVPLPSDCGAQYTNPGCALDGAGACVSAPQTMIVGCH